MTRDREKAKNQIESPQVPTKPPLTPQWHRCRMSRQHKHLNNQQDDERAVESEDGPFHWIREEVVAVRVYRHPAKNKVMELAAREADSNPEQRAPSQNNRDAYARRRHREPAQKRHQRGRGENQNNGG